jgi:biopolymer transport protein ExbD
MAHKPKRGAPAIDMTAMVDVAFLLLTFFILTTSKFREDQSVEVDTPSSISSTELPDEGVMTISVDSEGKVFLGFSDIPVREAALKRAAGEKGWNLTEDGVRYFTTLQDFGVPFKEMEKWLNAEDLEYTQPGISAVETDTVAHTGNELKDWVRWGRLSDTRMRLAIKGDSQASYEAISNVINTLQDWKINRFSLITNLEEPPEGMNIQGRSKIGWDPNKKKAEEGSE